MATTGVLQSACTLCSTPGWGLHRLHFLQKKNVCSLGCSVDICVLQGNLCSIAWSTSSHSLFSDLSGLYLTLLFSVTPHTIFQHFDLSEISFPQGATVIISGLSCALQWGPWSKQKLSGTACVWHRAVLASPHRHPFHLPSTTKALM